MTGVPSAWLLGYRIGGGSYSSMHSDVQGIVFQCDGKLLPSPCASGLSRHETHHPGSFLSRKGRIEEAAERRSAFETAKDLISEKRDLAAFDPVPTGVITNIITPR